MSAVVLNARVFVSSIGIEMKVDIFIMLTILVGCQVLTSHSLLQQSSGRIPGLILLMGFI
jgi:hypothetical protein